MEASYSWERWTFAQKALVTLAALQLLWALAGFIAEPSFQIGSDAPTEKVLWVDFNGIHALSGLLLFAPAFYFARRPDWALYYTLYIVVALYATGIWALFDQHPLPRRRGNSAAPGPDASRFGLTQSQPVAIASARQTSCMREPERVVIGSLRNERDMVLRLSKLTTHSRGSPSSASSLTSIGMPRILVVR